MSEEREDLWVVVPAAQRRDGTWIDDTLTARNREAGQEDRAPDAGRFPRQRVELFRGPGAATTVDETYRRRGWTDGLPVVAPTTGRVAALVAAVEAAPRAVLGELAPLGGQATVERVAANAVMAGCGPTQFPFVAAAVDAIVDPAFNLAGVQTTDENVAPLVIVSGPDRLRAEAEINAGMGVLGPGWRGNAAIGRAIRLVLQNLGGGWPGAVSLAGAGQPGRYGLVVAEDDAACPWPPLRVELGLDPDQTAVVVLRAESAVNVTGGLAEIASAMSSATSLFTAAHHGGGGGIAGSPCRRRPGEPGPVPVAGGPTAGRRGPDPGRGVESLVDRQADPGPVHAVGPRARRRWSRPAGGLRGRGPPGRAPARVVPQLGLPAGPPGPSGLILCDRGRCAGRRTPPPIMWLFGQGLTARGPRVPARPLSGGSGCVVRAGPGSVGRPVRAPSLWAGKM